MARRTKKHGRSSKPELSAALLASLAQRIALLHPDIREKVLEYLVYLSVSQNTGKYASYDPKPNPIIYYNADPPTNATGKRLPHVRTNFNHTIMRQHRLIGRHTRTRVIMLNFALREECLNILSGANSHGNPTPKDEFGLMIHHQPAYTFEATPASARDNAWGLGGRLDRHVGGKWTNRARYLRVKLPTLADSRSKVPVAPKDEWHPFDVMNFRFLEAVYVDMSDLRALSANHACTTTNPEAALNGAVVQHCRRVTQLRLRPLIPASTRMCPVCMVQTMHRRPPALYVRLQLPFSAQATQNAPPGSLPTLIAAGDDVLFVASSRLNHEGCWTPTFEWYIVGADTDALKATDRHWKAFTSDEGQFQEYPPRERKATMRINVCDTDVGGDFDVDTTDNFWEKLDELLINNLSTGFASDGYHVIVDSSRRIANRAPPRWDVPPEVRRNSVGHWLARSSDNILSVDLMNNDDEEDEEDDENGNENENEDEEDDENEDEEEDE